MPPSLVSYQAAANAIYDPLAQGEISQAAATRDANIATLEGQKGGVTQNYNDSIYGLNKKTSQNSAQIQQQYTLALGGNFSGLQGNDMGMMFADAAHEQGTIEQARDSALNDISTKQTNEKTLYNANAGAITNKYNSSKTQYAQEQYGSAMNAYQQSLIDQQKLQIQQQNANTSASKSSSGGGVSAAQAKQQNLATLAQTLQSKIGKDNHVSQETWNAAINAWTSAGYSASEFVKNNIRFINQRYKGYSGFN